MSSVTQRINQIKQPRGGYLNPNLLEKEQLYCEKSLNPEENVSSGLVGLAVDYLTRFMKTGDKFGSFSISLRGAKIIGQEGKCAILICGIKGLDDDSIIRAVKVVGFDVCFRAGPMGYRSVDEIRPDASTIENIRIMVERSLHFFEKYGPVIKDGFTFEGGYTKTVDTGDGDFLTADTLWDFKVTSKEPTSKHTLQVLMYYVMGMHSRDSTFKAIKKIGFFNPRLNCVYTYDISEISTTTIAEIEKDVICY